MKKIIAISMALALMLTAVACGSKEDTQTSAPSTNEQTEVNKEENKEPAKEENLTVKFENAIKNAYGEGESMLTYCPVLTNQTQKTFDFLVSLGTATKINVDENKALIEDAVNALDAIKDDEMYNVEIPEDASDDDKAYYQGLLDTKNGSIVVVDLLKDMLTKSGEVEVTLTDDQKKALELSTNAYNDLKVRNVEMVFGILTDAEGTVIKPTQDLEAYAISMSWMMTQVHTVAIFKPVAGKEDFVYNVLQNRLDSMKTTFETYLPDQYEITKQAKITKLDDNTVVLVMTEDSENIYNSIMESLK